MGPGMRGVHDRDRRVGHSRPLMPVKRPGDHPEQRPAVRRRQQCYLSGPDDVYVSLSQVRRNGLRKGDAVTGAVRQPREGERREKFNALVRLDTVNGVDPEQSKKRPDFSKLIANDFQDLETKK